MRSQALENTAAVAEAVFIFCLALTMADNGKSAFDNQLSKVRQSRASDETDIRSVMTIDERKRNIIIITTTNHSDDKDSRDAARGKRSSASIESNRQTLQSIGNETLRHRKTSDHYDDDDDDDDDEEEEEAKTSSRIASKILSPQGRQQDRHRVSESNRSRAIERLTRRRRQKRQYVGRNTPGNSSGGMVGDDGSQRMKPSYIHANEPINNLPPVLRWRVVATNDAEQMVIRGYMNNGRPDQKSQSAYDSAKKEEREVLKLILSVEGQESIYLIRNYRSLRTGIAQNDLTLDPEFKGFFSKPSDALNAYRKMKMEEADGLDALCKLCKISPQTNDLAMSGNYNLQQPQKQEEIRKSEAGTYKADSFANNRTPPAMQRSQPGFQTNPQPSKSSWETIDSPVAVWDQFKLKAESWNASSALPFDLNKYTRSTDDAEIQILEAAVQKNEIPENLIVSYNASKEIERKQLKAMIDNPPSGMTGARILAAYKTLRKGTIWESVASDEKYRILFSRPSAVRTQYEKLKRDEFDSLDDFLKKPTNRTTGEKEEEEEEEKKKKRADTEKEDDRTRKSERTQREEIVEESLENQRSEENEKQKNLEENMKRRAKLREILKQRSKMQKLQKERLDEENEQEKTENLGEKLRREEEQQQKHNRHEKDQTEKSEENKEENLDLREENAANSEDFAGKEDVDIVERVLRNVSESKRNDESTAPQDTEGGFRRGSDSGSAAGGRQRSSSGVLWVAIIVGIIAEVIVISLVLFAYRNDVFKRSERKRRTSESEHLISS